MKKLMLVLLLPFIVNAQEITIGGELIIFFENRPSSWQLTVKIENYGTVWDQYHDITNEYQGGDTSYSQSSERYWHASDLDWHNQGWKPVLSLGFYEVSIWEGSNKRAWFIINYRTSHLPYAATLGNIDLNLEYDVTNKNLEFTFPNIGNVTDGSYYTIWDLKNFVNHTTTGLEDYWENCLDLIHDSDFHPKLVWGVYPDTTFDVTGYKVYRAVSTFSTPVPTTFSYLSTVGSTQYYYVDDQYDLGYGWYTFYKVTAIDGTTESDYSNVVMTSIDAFNKKNNSDKMNSAISDYSLNQNYPNPFNPLTVISWYSPKDDFVTIEVFDILGRKIMVLLNEFKQAGIHYVEFDAKNLPSGIYFYQLQTGNFMETRKLILQK